MAKRQRMNGLYIMLTDEEIALFKQKLKSSKCKSMNHFIRKCVLEKNIFVLDMKPFYELHHLLGINSNNLNQIAKRVNSTGIIYKDDIKDLQKMNTEFAKELLKIEQILKNKTNNTR